MTEQLGDDVDALVAAIPNGAKLAVFKPDGGCAMTATRTLIRRGVKNLHLVTVPTAGLQADLLIGAGCVATVETSGVTLGEFGQAPAFGRAVKSGAIKILDATCPAIYSALQAGEKAIPFIPFRGLIGSDILANRADWTIVDNPFAPEGQRDPIVALPAIAPDFSLFHAPLADAHGNVWIGMWHELKTMAHASLDTLVTYETYYDGNLMENAELAPATISSLYISAVAEAKNGSWPMALPGHYDIDEAHLADYAGRAATVEGFKSYLEETVFHRGADAAAAE